MRQPEHANTQINAVSAAHDLPHPGAALEWALPALTLALALLLFACATTPTQYESALAQAQYAVRTLEADPLAAATAAKPLQHARESLAAAARAQQDHRASDEVIHLAYLARRHAEIGEAVIAETRARDLMAEAQTRRDQVLLAARVRDAVAARQQARSAEAQAAAAQDRTAKPRRATARQSLG